jgi:predicted alpha/beta superfamily hydrolase
MKKWILLSQGGFILFLAVFFGRIFWGQYQQHLAQKEFEANVTNTASPGVTVLRDSFLLDYQNERRTLHVYVPPGYAEDSLSYPVLYFMDGESAFNDMENMAPEWQIDEVIDSTVRAGGPGAIVIGIAQSDQRDPEYTPFPIEDYPNAHGDQYIDWVATKLKPWVDTTFRTMPGPESTGIGGISRSGMMAYYALMAHPEVFGMAVIQSPSLWVDEERLLAMDTPAADLAGRRAFVSVGELETPMIRQAQAIHDKLLASGIREGDLRLEVIPGEGHWHMAWRKSFAMAYPWLAEKWAVEAGASDMK